MANKVIVCLLLQNPKHIAQPNISSSTRLHGQRGVRSHWVNLMEQNEFLDIVAGLEAIEGNLRTK